MPATMTQSASRNEPQEAVTVSLTNLKECRLFGNSRILWQGI